MNIWIGWLWFYNSILLTGDINIITINHVVQQARPKPITSPHLLKNPIHNPNPNPKTHNPPNPIRPKHNRQRLDRQRQNRSLQPAPNPIPLQITNQHLRPNNRPKPLTRHPNKRTDLHLWPGDKFKTGVVDWWGAD